MSVATREIEFRTVDAYTQRLCRRARAGEDESQPWLRGLEATRVYRDHPDWPAVLQRAEIAAATMERQAPIVLPEDRLAGVVHRRNRVHGGVSDADAWRQHVQHPERYGPDAAAPIPDDARRELEWWKGRAIALHARNPLRRKHAWLQRFAVAHPHGFVNGHTLPDHGILLRHGIAGLRRQIAERLQRPHTPPQRDQLRAMDRVLEGLSHHALLSARAARERADIVDDATLKRRLYTLAECCEFVAERAPETFHQALQLLIFSNHADLMDNNGDASSFGRVDQLLHPFYQADSAAGRLTEGDAFELVCHLLIRRWTRQTSANMTIGGVDEAGRDATNEVSWLILDALAATKMVVDLSVRVHAGTPPDLFRHTMRVMRLSLGRPGIYNDEVTIPALVDKGIEISDARDYAPLGCVEVMIPGRTAARTMSMGMNLPKVFELTLNGGRCLVTGEVVWADAPDEFASFDALRAEYHRRVQQVVGLGVAIIREDERLEPEMFPRPWLTVLSRGGIEDAIDMTAGQPAYDPVGVTLDGIADIADSLYAVQRLVFQERRLTLSELRDILRNNWEGSEPLRRFIIQRRPRFGQDDGTVNRLAAEEADHYAACFDTHQTAYGGRFWPMIFGVSAGLVRGAWAKTGATPSGRKHGQSMAMSLQPNPAGPQGSITELLRSVTAIDFHDFPGGISNVQECDPSLVEGEAGLDRLVDIVRGFCELGGMELALNFLTPEQLREAQRKPDEYQHLMVRLFGLSAQFVNLSPQLQETVIERVAAARRRCCRR